MATTSKHESPGLDKFQIHAKKGESPITFTNSSPLDQIYLKHIRQDFLSQPSLANQPPQASPPPSISKPEPLYTQWIISDINDPDGRIALFAEQFNLDIPSKFVRPYGICLDNGNNIYVTDWSTRLVYKLDASNQKLLWIHNLPPNGVPFGLTYSKKNNKLYVVDAQQWKIWILDPETGQALNSFGRQGVKEGQFIHPTGISTDADGYIYITDRYINRLHRFDADGNNPVFYQILPKESAEYNITGILAIGSGENLKLYVTDSFNDNIIYFSYNPFHEHIPPLTPTIWGSNGDRDGEFNAPTAIAYNSDLYVLEQSNRRIQRFSGGRAYIAKGEKLSGKYTNSHEYFFNGAEGLAVDSNGELYVADTVNLRILKIAALTPKSSTDEPAPEIKPAFSKQIVDLRAGKWVKTLQQYERLLKMAEERYQAAKSKHNSVTGISNFKNSWDEFIDIRSDILSAASVYIDNRIQEQYNQSTTTLLNIPETDIANADSVSKLKQLISQYLNYGKPVDWHATTETLINDIFGNSTVQESRHNLYQTISQYSQKKTQLAETTPAFSYDNLDHSEESFLQAIFHFVSAEKYNQDNFKRATEWYRQFSNSWDIPNADDPNNQIDEWWRELVRYARGTSDFLEAWAGLQKSSLKHLEQIDLHSTIHELDITSTTFVTSKNNLLNAEKDLLNIQDALQKFKDFLALQGITGTADQLKMELHYRHRQELQKYEKINDLLRKQSKHFDVRYYAHINNEYIDQYGLSLFEHIKQFKTIEDHKTQSILHLPYPQDGENDDFYKRYLIIYNPVFSGVRLHPPSVFFQEKFTLNAQWSGISLGEMSHSISLFPGEQRTITLTTVKKRTENINQSSSIENKQTTSKERNLASKQSDNFLTKLSDSVDTNRALTKSLSNTSNYESNHEVGFDMGIGDFLKFDITGKTGAKGNIENSRTTSLSSVRKRTSNIMRQVSTEVSVNNKLSFQTSSSASESKQHNYKTEDLETTKTNMNLANNNSGKTINYNFFQLRNNYSALLFADNLKILFDSGIELIPGTELTLSKSYNINDYQNIIRDFQFIDDTSALSKDIVLLISADLIRRYLAAHSRDHSKISPKLLRTVPRNSKKWLALRSEIKLAHSTQTNETLLDSTSSIHQGLLDFISSQKMIVATQVSEEELYSVNSGKWFLDAHLGYHVATEPYLEKRRAIETERQQALVEEITARSDAGEFPTQLPENLKALSINGNGIGSNISINLQDSETTSNEAK